MNYQKFGGIYSYNFTTSQDQAHLYGQVNLATGNWGMSSGDSDASGVIDSADKTILWESSGWYNRLYIK